MSEPRELRKTSFHTDRNLASLAGFKSGQTRRAMKAYKEQHRAAMISKAEEIVSNFFDGKPILGIDLKSELREKIIQSVISEVATESLVGALRYRDNVDLIMLRHELTSNPNPITGVDNIDSDEQANQPAMLTNAELMQLIGSQSEAKSRQSYDPLGDLSDLPDLGDGDDDDDGDEGDGDDSNLPEHFFTWYQSLSQERQDSILKAYFHDDLEQLLNHAGRPTLKVCSELNIRV